MTTTPTLTGRFKAGSLGGIQTLNRHGRDFFRRIGKMGGRARRNPSKRA